MTEAVKMPAEELEAALAADRQRRMMAVQNAIQAALKEHRCRLLTDIVVVDGRLVDNVRVEAL